LCAERPTDALRVLSGLALPLLDTGGAARILEALDRIPADAATHDPEDAIRYAWCHLAAGRTTFVDTLALVEATTGTGAQPSRSRMRTLRAVSHWLRGDWPHAAAEARDAPQATSATSPSHPVDRFGRRLISCGIALDERWDEGAVVVSERRVACLTDPSTRESFDAVRALGLALAGRPIAALQAVERATSGAGSGRNGSLGVQLALAEGILERELDHREHARALLEELSGRATYPDPVVQLIAQLELVRLRISNGDLGGASAELQDVEGLCARLAGPTPGSALAAAPSSLVARVRVDLALDTDDTATAIRWTEDVSDPFWRPAYEAKVALACGREDQAQQALHRAAPRCPRHEVVSGLLLGQALARQDRGAAAERVGTTMRMAADHGMLRTVAAEGSTVMELIELGAWRVSEEWMSSLRRALVPTWVAKDARRPIEDLTDRERDVLRLLPSRLTLSEIAAELYVSQNTLKFHLRAIYRKLGAVSRAGAVDSARHMLLLPRG
jgi:LuxR family maltose regulon positive regulatory protein